MKRYRVILSKAATKAIRKLDPSVSRMLVSWIEKNLEGCANPRAFGKGMSGDRAGQWRYRVGDYRLVAIIQDETVSIFMLDAGHRSTIYDR